MLMSTILPVRADDVLLLSYFDSNGENGVYLTWSRDGRTFHPINNAKPIFTPPQWKGQNLTRDPSIVFHDGVFHMVWTSNWNGPYFGYANSPDLKTWSEPKRIRPFPEGTEQPKNVWAPEIFRDHVAENFKIVWSSTLPSEMADGDGSEDRHEYDHRMFFNATEDFEQFSEPQWIFEDPNYSVIDAFVVFDPGNGNAEGRWIMPLKKEVSGERGGKNIRLAFSPPQITRESFRDATEPIVGMGASIQGGKFAEGPSLIRWHDEWLLYWDAYTAGHYSLATSKDLKTWTDRSSELSVPVTHPRHGTVLVADDATIAWELKAD